MEEFAKMIYSQWQNEDNTISWDDYDEVIGKLYEILNDKLADDIERTINKRVWKVQRSLVNAYFALRNQHPAPTSTTAIEEKPTLEFETDWFCINRGKINYICRCYDITSKEYMHHLLEVLGRTYNFDEAKRIYSATTGNWKCRNSEVITYFPQLSDLASKIIQKDLEDCAKEETP